MTDDASTNPALLPAGLRDLLPPEAETEAAAVETLMEVFAQHGYERVKPPLLEFEDSLFAGSGAAVAEQTFRLMDPDSQRMMGLRADTTPQVARIATTRLARAPRPLRLSYAGQCLMVRGSQLAPDRQIAQAGIELIGSRIRRPTPRSCWWAPRVWPRSGWPARVSTWRCLSWCRRCSTTPVSTARRAARLVARSIARTRRRWRRSAAGWRRR